MPQRKNSKIEVVSLDDMGWLEFQHFTAHLFQKLGFGEPEDIKKGSDCGRDVILHTPSGELIIIECKHHPRSSIGRPTVQKLHSAILTAKSKKGYLVTTGKFSPAAVEYSRSLGSTIELVDLRVLADMANRAGIRVLQKGENTIVYHVSPPSDDLIKKTMLRYVVGIAQSSPKTPRELIETKINEVNFIPAYLFEYSLHQNFSTAVGTIHQVDVNRGQLLIDGQDGTVIKPEFAKYVKLYCMVEQWVPPKKDETVYSSGKFKLGLSTVKKRGINFVRALHTETVNYVGGNNVCYSKKCVPNKSSIFVRSISQVYIPFLNVKSKIISQEHQLEIVGNTENAESVDIHHAKCELCGDFLGEKRLLCNSCGRVVHAPKFFVGHSYNCEICKKTICKECTLWTRKYIFFKKKLCEDCGHELEAQGKKVKAFKK